MGDVDQGTEAGDTATHTPPPPPEPAHNETGQSIDSRHGEKSDEPLLLESEDWDITSISPLAALRMLIQALERLVEATGDIPPTPPVSRPTTPRKEADNPLMRLSTPKIAAIPPITIGSPEAHPHEPIAIIAGDAPDLKTQHAAIGRRFFSKTPPGFTLSDYLLRLHKHCPHSPGVYLAAATFCYRLCVSELVVPATNRTIHRLALAAIRVSAKALEDNNWRQAWVVTVGGIGMKQMMNLEVALCFLLDFDIWVDEEILRRGMWLLQEAARKGVGGRGKLSEEFRLKLPLRRKIAIGAA